MESHDDPIIEARASQVTEVALALGTYDQILAAFLRRLRAELDTDEATVLLVNADNQALTVRASDGLYNEREQGSRVPVGSGLAGRVAERGRPIVIADLAQADVVSALLRERIKSVAAVPVYSGDTVIGVLHVGTRSRREFQPHEVRLLELVGERMAGVLARTRLFAELEAALRLRDEVLSVVSHDLRNPVSAIAMSAALLADPEIDLSETERRAQLGVITRSAKRMNRLIQDLLDVARIERGRFTISCRVENPGALAGEAFESFRQLADEKDITLTCRADHDLPRVNVDRDRVLQVLSNYLNNALKFTPSGGCIALDTRAADGGVRFTVCDTGPGIAAEAIPHLFSGFWQAKGTAHLGSGLGLAIAKGVADAHKGRVWVDTAPGKGSRFYLWLPAARSA